MVNHRFRLVRCSHCAANKALLLESESSQQFEQEFGDADSYAQFPDDESHYKDDHENDKEGFHRGPALHKSLIPLKLLAGQATLMAGVAPERETQSSLRAFSCRLRASQAKRLFVQSLVDSWIKDNKSADEPNF